MSEPITIEIFVAVNECGDFEISAETATDVTDNLRDNYGFEAIRIVKMLVTVSPPEQDITEIAITAPAEAKAPAQVTVS